jgi:hypothetical protein
MDNNTLLHKKLNAIMAALIYKIQSEPNYQRHSDYGTPEAAWHVIRMEKLIDDEDPDEVVEDHLGF